MARGGEEWRGAGPFIVVARRIVDAVQGSKGEAGAAMGCPYGRGVAVDACGVVAWSGGASGEAAASGVLARPSRTGPVGNDHCVAGAASCVGLVASRAAKGAAER